jgi:PleD family two-component response regulator
MNILIVDDNAEDRNLIKVYILKSKKKEIQRIDENDDLESSFEKIKKYNYDVIFLDVPLPNTKGIEAVTKLINFLEKINKNIPVIALSDSEDYKLGVESFKVGIKDFIIKSNIFKNKMEAKELERALTFATYSKHLPKRNFLMR